MVSHGGSEGTEKTVSGSNSSMVSPESLPYPKIIHIWWEWSLTLVAPIVLGAIIVWSLVEELTQRYGDYPKRALILVGVSWLALSFLAGLVFSFCTKHRLAGIPEDRG